MPVMFVPINEVGVAPSNNVAPVPSSSVKAPLKLDEVNEPNEVAFPDEVIAPVKFAFVVTVPAVRPDAVPVKFVATPLEGVPNAPPLTIKDPAVPIFTPNAVCTPVPKVIADCLLLNVVQSVDVKNPLLLPLDS